MKDSLLLSLQSAADSFSITDLSSLNHPALFFPTYSVANYRKAGLAESNLTILIG